MTEDANDEGGALAENLFGHATLNSTKEHLTKAGDDFDRGAIGQGREHIHRAKLEIARTLTSLTSRNLSEDENKEWLGLQKRKFNIDAEANISENPLDEKSEERLKALEAKAFPPRNDK